MKTLDVLTYTYDGNRLTRMEESDMADANGNIEEYNHYYPYGALMNISSASTQPYKYNGKELNRLNRLLWYDQSARQYNPILGRFMSMDPLCEKYYSTSPYAFCAGNPVRFVDLDGRQLGDFIDKNGNVIGSDGKNDGKLYVINTKENNFHENREIGDGVKGANNTKYKQVVDFVKANSTPSAYDADKTAFENSTEIESSKDIRQQMVNYVTEGDKKNSFKEYGGNLISDIEGRTTSITKEVGPEGDPRTGGAAIYLFFTSSNYHSHCSGMIAGAAFVQHPSQTDIDNSGDKINYVFGMRDNKTYIYNNKGILAVLPTKKFVSPTPIKK